MMWIIFSYAYLPSAYLLWCGVHLGLLPILKSGCFLIVLRVLCIFWIIVLYQMCLLQILSPSLWPVHSLDIVFHRAEVFDLMKSNLSTISSMDPAYGIAAYFCK